MLPSLMKNPPKLNPDLAERHKSASRMIAMNLRTRYV
jgi:hypothetical protein